MEKSEEEGKGKEIKARGRNVRIFVGAAIEKLYGVIAYIFVWRRAVGQATLRNFLPYRLSGLKIKVSECLNPRSYVRGCLLLPDDDSFPFSFWVINNCSYSPY